MKKIFFVIALYNSLVACKLGNNNSNMEANNELAALFDKYYDERMQLFPLEATTNGDNRFNDQMPVDFTDSYRAKLKIFYSKYLSEINEFDRDHLNDNDKISFDIFKYEMQISLEGLSFHSNYIPTNQFWGRPLDMGPMGSGSGIQPFKTVQDYDNWIKRASAFSAWSDSAIVYFRKGISANFILPKALVIKMIPQLETMKVSDVTKSIFWGPINNFPNDFSDADEQRLTEAYTKLINEQIIPSYKKLANFLKDEYLPKARTSTGIDSLPDGDKYYRYLVHYWTTTDKTPDEIYNTGLAEVKRIRGIMDSVKNAVGFKGDLNAFFEYMRTDKKFMPYKTPQEVLDAFHAIQQKEEPYLKTMFGRTPKTKFEIRHRSVSCRKCKRRIHAGGAGWQQTRRFLCSHS